MPLPDHGGDQLEGGMIAFRIVQRAWAARSALVAVGLHVGRRTRQQEPVERLQDLQQVEAVVESRPEHRQAHGIASRPGHDGREVLLALHLKGVMPQGAPVRDDANDGPDSAHGAATVPDRPPGRQT